MTRGFERWCLEKLNYESRGSPGASAEQSSVSDKRTGVGRKNVAGTEEKRRLVQRLR